MITMSIRSITKISIIAGLITALSGGFAAAADSLQSFSSETPVQNGTIVQLTDAKGGKVGVATKKKSENTYGVTVDRNKLSITVSDDSIKNQVYVATSGTYETLVSNEGGAIKPGDWLTVSSVNGVAMKVADEDVTVLGRAVGSFNGKTNAFGSVELKNDQGQKYKTVTLGKIPVTVDIKRNPNQKSTKTNVPKPLERIGQAIAEKPVGPLRIYLSLAITGISLIAAIAILYSGVRNSLFSIGRNPLSKKSILRALLEIILTSIIILIVGLFAVYLLLKL